MTTITIADIQQVLNKLLNNQLKLEEASSWAYDLTVKNDYRTLQFEPEDDKPIILEAINFISAIDLKTAPDVYLLGIEDMKDMLTKIENR